MSEEKIVCFAGHRDEWRNVGIEEKLETTIEELILKGYTIFYDGGKGHFDDLCAGILLKLKKNYPYIKIYRVLSNYNHRAKETLNPNYTDFVMPDIEKFHPKQRITKRNEWMVESCNVLVCHIVETYKSGAYNTLKYAQKLHKPIIYID